MTTETLIQNLDDFRAYMEPIWRDIDERLANGASRDDLEEHFSERIIDTAIAMAEAGFGIEEDDGGPMWDDECWAIVHEGYLEWEEWEPIKGQPIPEVGDYIKRRDEEALVAVTAVYFDGVPGAEEWTEKDVWVRGEDDITSCMGTFEVYKRVN